MPVISSSSLDPQQSVSPTLCVHVYVHPPSIRPSILHSSSIRSPSFIHPSIHPSILRPFIHTFSFQPSILYPSIPLSILHPSSIHPSIHPSSIHPSIHPSSPIHLLPSIHLSIHPFCHFSPLSSFPPSLLLTESVLGVGLWSLCTRTLMILGRGPV